MPENIIVDTAPIFYLHRLGLLELLKKLYSKIIVPTAVVNELDQGKFQGEDIPNLRTISWIKIREVKISGFLKLVPDLGPGEAEVLTLGLENPNSLVIIDDLLARHIAELQRLKFTGTAGVLLKAKHKSYIISISHVITQLTNLGFWISDKLKQDIIQLAKEDEPKKE